ncbi:LacI family transcriptional regulator [Frondihabitans sp. PAMC 28766]|uniref:LacI family DNA-binding transcriptional regulator n=1 Tax=Frondihabitans sp. PAMC 28766 TaxID=1795630 RepID=UPI00078E64D4|nr:LacI family DNA-binding transcriptional regulator [Frondihabitans sp. PAMC 28766]AMM18894.1 LacI family transcriptional regulator [Frondihabitans sp. PAMC 28766]
MTTSSRPPGARPATIKDVAREAGVSVSVVSRVLNDGSGPVAPETRQRVVATMEALSYRPRAAARDLNRATALSVAFVVPDLTNPLFARLADRIVWEARARGVQVVMMTTQEDPYLERELVTSLLDRSVGGVIAVPTGENADAWQALRDRDVQVVFASRSVETVADIDSVSIRNAEAARIATTHLIERGHRRIGFVSGPAQTSTGHLRLAGYREALESAGLADDPALHRHVPFLGHGGAEAAAAILALADPPTAFVVANSAQVQGVLLRLRAMGVRLPDDLSVIAFDDTPWMELIEPPLTSVRQPTDLIALHSIEILLSRMQGTAPALPRHVEVAADLVERSSVRTLVPASVSTPSAAPERL